MVGSRRFYLLNGELTIPLRYSVKPKSTRTLLKPSFETLVSSFVFPQLSFNATKQALLWEFDPIDYIRISVGTSPLSTLP
jgi:hypothetical protein